MAGDVNLSLAAVDRIQESLGRIEAVTKLMTQCCEHGQGWPEMIRGEDIASAGGIILNEVGAIHGLLRVYGEPIVLP